MITKTIAINIVVRDDDQTLCGGYHCPHFEMEEDPKIGGYCRLFNQLLMLDEVSWDVPRCFDCEKKTKEI